MLSNAALVAGLMLGVWLLSLWLRDVSIIDVAWGIGFVAIAWNSFRLDQPTWVSPQGWLIAMVTLWGLRLGGYLLLRKWGTPEDHRYQAMRRYHGPRFWWVSLLTVFLLQGIVMFVVALPLQFALAHPSPRKFPLEEPELLAPLIVGGLLWFTGLFFETVGDWQLARFKANPKNAGQVMDRGLWRFTRHPNYFGDFLVWWGFFVFCYSLGAPVWTVVSPLIMSVLLMRVSGVTLLEATLKETKPGYAEYIRRTSPFFPWPPRR